MKQNIITVEDKQVTLCLKAMQREEETITVWFGTSDLKFIRIINYKTAPDHTLILEIMEGLI